MYLSIYLTSITNIYIYITIYLSIGEDHEEVMDNGSDFILKFITDGTLGLKIELPKESHINPLVILDVVPDTLAAAAVDMLGDDTITKEVFKSCVIRSINGKNVVGINYKLSIDLLKGSRPLYIGVRVNETGRELLKETRIIKNNRIINENNDKLIKKYKYSSTSQRLLKVYKVNFVEGSLGIYLSNYLSNILSIYLSYHISNILSYILSIYHTIYLSIYLIFYLSIYLSGLKLKDTNSCGGAIIIQSFIRGIYLSI
jgi:hypothetical protein